MRKRSNVMVTILTVIAIVCMLGGVFALGVSYAHGETNFYKSDEVKQTVKIEVENISEYNYIKIKDVGAKVNLHESDNSDMVLVKLSGKSKILGSYTTPSVTYTSGVGEYVEISLEYFKGAFIITGLNKLTLDVYIPSAYKGDILIHDAAGQINVFSDSDTIPTAYIDTLDIKDCAGDVTIKGHYNDVKISNALGKVSIENYDNFNTMTVSDCTGKLNMKISPSVKGNFTASDCLGNITADFQVNKSNSKYTAAINGGGNSVISVKDCMGAVEIKYLNN